MSKTENHTLYEFAEVKTAPEIYLKYSVKGDPESIPLVIDNGSYQFRAGWGNDKEPSLVFKNIIARNRGNRKDREWDVLVGSDIPDLEAVRWMIRTAFDFNVVVNFSIQEAIFDHAFSHLGIDSDGGVNHPIVLTEPVANPCYSRKQMSELLFEAYNIPKLAYGVDSLFSYQHNKNALSLNDNALIISSGFQSTHVLPVINGIFDLNNAKRVNLGGYNNGAYLQRLLQLRYPKQSSVFTLTRMDQFLREKGEVPIDYMEEIQKWLDPKFESENRIMMKVPEKSNSSGSQGTNPPSKKTILLGRKLRQMEYKLYDLECISELEQELPDAFAKAMTDAGCKTTDELNKKIKRWQTKLDKMQSELTVLAQHNPILTEVPIGLEKHQGLEILFQPTLVGYEQAGIGEVIEMVLAAYPQEQQAEMAKNVLVTGGNTQYKGFLRRIEAELVKCRPFGASCCVRAAENPSLDAWKGARQWALDHFPNQDVWMTRKDFDENGWEYIKEHNASNKHLQPSTGQG